MMKPYTPTSAGSAAGVIPALAALATALSAAGDEQAVLATTVEYLQRFGLQRARLVYIHLDSQAGPGKSQVVAQWPTGQDQSDSTEHSDEYRLAQDAIAQRGLGKAAEPLLLTDSDQLRPPPAGEAPADGVHAAGYPWGCKAMALLPLHSERDGGWQGLLTLYWTVSHVFSPEEADAYRLLIAVLGMCISGLRSERELGAALTEAALLHEVTKKLNVAMTLEDALRAMLLPAPAADEAEVTLCTLEPQPSGAPGWVTVVGAWTAKGQLGTASIGTRYFLPDIPFAKLYTSSPDAPLLINDVMNDPRVDDYARVLYAASGTRATIVMALTLQGRWVGLFSVSWKHPVQLTQREQRLYQALAKPAALLLDNSLMVERLRTSLRETQQQGALLQTILDNIPVGVVLLEMPSSQVVLGNAHVERILGRPLDKQLPGGQESTVENYRFVQPGTDVPIPATELATMRAMRSGKTETTEMDILQEKGERIHAEVNAVPIFDENGAVKRVIILLMDLTSRKRAEEERARLQQEIIRVQAETLAERSSPLIPITDEILVLPLIGSIDTERGQQVLDTVLHGTSQRGARVAIIDITGVGIVDTHAAATLTNAAQALRLLGVEPVLTGIRAEVAQTLVSLGIELSGIVTRSTLQAGIQYALRRLKKTLTQ